MEKTRKKDMKIHENREQQVKKKASQRNVSSAKCSKSFKAMRLARALSVQGSQERSAVQWEAKATPWQTHDLTDWIN